MEDSKTRNKTLFLVRLHAKKGDRENIIRRKFRGLLQGIQEKFYYFNIRITFLFFKSIESLVILVAPFFGGY